MKKLTALAIIAVAATAFVSSCKKEESAEPAPAFKVKSLGDIKEHTGWDHSDSTNNGSLDGSGDINTNP
jgi:hypothetical protein